MIGTKVGHYVLTRVLGTGGMGTVYLAEHEVLEEKRAVKVLNPWFSQNRPIVTRFVNEARAAAKLRHEALIRVHDIGQLPNGAWYMVLDYLEGQTLAQYIHAQGKPIPAPTILEILFPVLDCLRVVHTAGVVHRDLKPDNIFLVFTRDRIMPVVLDLGVAQLGELVGGAGTQAGVVIGTPRYMAPEQLRGQRVAPPADIFALGVTAYEMATGGYAPFQRNEIYEDYIQLSATELLERQQLGVPVDPRERCPQLSDELARAILAAIAFHPHQRPANGAAFAMLLAKSVTTDGFSRDGLEILHTVAKDLEFDSSDASSETLRALPVPLLQTATGKPRYRVGERIGAGGMAEVFVGTQIGLEGFERRVAIKRVLAGLSEVPAFCEMFIAEAQIASRLVHSNIVPVHDFSRDPQGRLFLVMELVHGRDLAAVLESGPIPPSLAIYIIVETLRGLGYAHDLGVIHRDVSPHNVLLGYEGDVKLGDFGLARARDASGNVHSENVRGKPSYMSPEQCSGEPLDGRSDLYSVGVMLWEMLAHQPLFSGTPREIMGQVMFKEIVPPSAIRPGVPRDLEKFVMTMIARDRNARYANAPTAIAELLKCDEAPRDGRGDLARLLGERRGKGLDARAATTGSANRRSLEPGRATGSAPRGDLALMPPQIATRPSTLGTAVSQTTGTPAPARKRGAALSVAALVVGALATFTIVRLAKPAAPPTADAPGHSQLDPGAGQHDAHDLANELDSAQNSIADAGQATEVRDAPVVADAAVGPLDAPVNAAPVVPDGGSRTTEAGLSNQQTSRTTSRAHGELIVTVKPWAYVSIDGKHIGETPVRHTVSAGHHRVRIRNENLGKDETIVVTVPADRSITIRRSW